MSWLQNGTAVVNSGNTVNTVTVPSGVISSQVCIFTLSGDVGTVSSATVSTSGSGTLTTFVAFMSVTNTYLVAYKGTGLVAGDTVTITTNVSSHGILSHFYFDADMVTIGSVGTRGGVNQNTVVAPTVTIAAASRVYAYSMSRNVSSITLSSVVNSNGDTMTQRYSNYTSAAPSVNVNLYEFTEPTTSTGTTTFTESGSSANAGAFHFAEATGLYASYDFEEGTDGGTINSGSYGVVATSGTVTYAASAAFHGSMGAQFNGSAAALGYNAPASGQVSAYGTCVTTSAANTTFISVRNGTNHLTRLRLDSSNGFFEIADGSNTVVATSSTAYSGTNFRVDLRYDNSGGSTLVVTARLFYNSNLEGTIPNETLGPVTMSAVGTPSRVYFGSNSTGWVYNGDTMRIYNTITTWPLPYQYNSLSWLRA